jgi:hypothetical protein
MANKQQQMPRRKFLKTTAGGVAGLALGSLPAASYANILGANDRVRVGVVGFSDRFRQSLLPAFGKLAKQHNFELVAVSDIWNRRRDEGVAQIEKVTGAKPQPFRNNEEMYDARVTDAVMISTADFQHAYHGVEAMQAGQDAYIEKPLAHTMENATAIRDAVTKGNRIVQIGTQRRSARNYQMANAFLRSGQFGDIVIAEMTWNVNQPGRWRRPQLVAAIREQDTDWTRFLTNLRANTSSTGCSGRTRRGFRTSGWCTKSTRCTGSRTSPAPAAWSRTAGCIYGRTAGRTGTPPRSCSTTGRSTIPPRASRSSTRRA